VWFDEWELKPGDILPKKIDEGLENSRVLVLCMSAQAFGSDWAQLEAGTFRFRDPLNKDRRFIPLRLDEAPIKGSLAQFLYINWLPQERDQAYPKLLGACRPQEEPSVAPTIASPTRHAEKVVRLDYKYADIKAYASSQDGQQVLTCSGDNTVRLWNVEAGRSLRLFKVIRTTSGAWRGARTRGSLFPPQMMERCACGTWRPDAAGASLPATRVQLLAWRSALTKAAPCLDPGTNPYVYGTCRQGGACVRLKTIQMMSGPLRGVPMDTARFLAQMTKQCGCGMWKLDAVCGSLKVTQENLGPWGGALIKSALCLAVAMAHCGCGT
jgi:hypothetical protein